MSHEMYHRPYPVRPIQGVMFSETICVFKVEQDRNKYGEVANNEAECCFVRASSNPLSADDERAADLQASGVRLSAVREFFTEMEVRVKERDEIEWKGERYIAIQSANWGDFFSTLAVKREDESNG